MYIDATRMPADNFGIGQWLPHSHPQLTAVPKRSPKRVAPLSDSRSLFCTYPLPHARDQRYAHTAAPCPSRHARSETVSTASTSLPCHTLHLTACYSCAARRRPRPPRATHSCVPRHMCTLSPGCAPDHHTAQAGALSPLTSTEETARFCHCGPCPTWMYPSFPCARCAPRLLVGAAPVLTGWE